MTITRDWVTVEEHASRKGVTRQAVYVSIWRGTFRLPYVQVGGLKGITLIHDPGAATWPIVNEPEKTKAQFAGQGEG